MKSEGSDQLVGKMENVHQLFNTTNTNHCLNVSSDILKKENLTIIELGLFDVLLHINKDFPFYQGEFTLEYLRKKLGINYTQEEFTEIFENLVNKNYIECIFDDQKKSVLVKMQ